MISLDAKLLEPLLKRAEETHSDAVVVLYQGETIGVWRFGKPKQLIQTMSITKSIVNLAVGKLITDGLLSSIDEPVCTFYPEWKQGRKKDITVKHIMNHMSGLQNETTTNIDIYPSPDFVQLALCAELEHDPGTQFAYNNKATNLLAGIVERLSGQKLDDFMANKIFAPQLSQEHITNLRVAKAPADTVKKLEQIQGVYTSQTNFVRALQSVFGAAWPEEQKRLPRNIKKFDVTHHGISICQATGFLGQYLWIFPQQQLVFVRMITGESFQSDKDNFSDFPKTTSSIAKSL